MNSLNTNPRSQKAESRTAASGNVLFAVFGAVVLVGLLGAGVTNFIKGPLNTAVKVTRTNAAKAQMSIAAQVSIMAASGGSTGMSEAKVFASSTTVQGRNIGGLAGADTSCQNLATTAGLTGTYKAWISDSTSSPSTRFNLSNVPYKLVNGTVIANNWADLIDGTLSAGININENGVTDATTSSAWTNTNTDGTVLSTVNTCAEWTGNTNPARVGLKTSASSTWTNSADAGSCSNAFRLYCFQQTSTVTTVGDCDSDGTTEPLEFRSAGAQPAPVGGGLIPTIVGIKKTDPWGTEYGYCVWDYGSVIQNASCQQNTPGTNQRLEGYATAGDTPILAIISAGPDRKFTTTCRNFSTGSDRADQNNNGVLTDSGDKPLVGKAATSDDDIIFSYSNTQATAATGGLWALKPVNTGVAYLNKKIESLAAKFSGAAIFQKINAASGDFIEAVSGLRLPGASAAMSCTNFNKYAMRRNVSSNGIEVCNGTAWMSLSASYYTPLTSANVFITTGGYNGNLGGLAGADSICQANANTAGLEGFYKAWLSDTTTSAASRIFQAPSGYKKVNGTTVANNWPDLIDSSIASAINVTAGGANAPASVWTGTEANATSSANNCDNWTNGTSGASGRVGNGSNTDSNWTVNGNANCDMVRRLYCFQTSSAQAGSSNFDALSDAFTENTYSRFFAGSGSGVTGTGVGVVSWGIANLTTTLTGADITAFGSDALKSSTVAGNTGVGYQALNYNTSNGGNTAVGFRAAYNGATATNSTAIGYAALGTTTGNYNMAFGYTANQSGASYNTAFGYEALRVNSSNSNTAVGFDSLYTNTGGNNTAVGFGSLYANTTNGNNTVAGSGAMYSNTAAYQTAAGYYAMNANTTGIANTAMGSDASRFATGSYNTSAGYRALRGSSGTSTGGNNTAIGFKALTANTTGTDNTAFGYQSLLANLTGSNNTAVGYGTLATVQAVDGNTAIGSYALNTTTTSGNTAFGSQTLKAQTTGSGNTAVGYNAGVAITDSSKHVIIGSGAQSTYNMGAAANTVTAVGFNALKDNTAGNNTAVGAGALAKNQTAVDNTAIGYNALSNTISGYGNTAIGSQALQSSTANNNTAIGFQTLKAVTTGNNNTAAGYQAGVVMTTGPYNTLAGYRTGAALKTGGKNTAAGYQALSDNIDSWNNTAIGYQALASTLSFDNTAYGNEALKSNTTGTGNTAAGYQALTLNTTGSANTALGALALSNLNDTGDVAADCTGLGSSRYNDATSKHCYFQTTATGTWAAMKTSCEASGGYLASITSLAESTILTTNLGLGATPYYIGGSDSGIEGSWQWTGGLEAGVEFWYGVSVGSGGSSQYGYYSRWVSTEPSTGSPATSDYATMNGSTGLWNTVDGATAYNGICEKDPVYKASYNTVAGYSAMGAATSGSRNTLIGHQAGFAMTSGDDNTGIGYQALGANVSGSKNTGIGDSAGPSIGGISNTTAIGFGATTTASNSVRVGNASVTVIEGAVAFTATSDARVKKDITPSDLGLDFIMGLKPVSYRLKQGNGRLDYGFLAQDIEASLDGRITNMITRRNDEMRTYQLRASDLIAPLVKAIQEQDLIIERLQKKIDAIKLARQQKACNAEAPEGDRK